MRVPLGSMGLSVGGTTCKRATAQARRISGCTLGSVVISLEQDRASFEKRPRALLLTPV